MGRVIDGPCHVVTANRLENWLWKLRPALPTWQWLSNAAGAKASSFRDEKLLEGSLPVGGLPKMNGENPVDWTHSAPFRDDPEREVACE